MKHRQGRRNLPRIISMAGVVYAKNRHRARVRGIKFSLPFVAFVELILRPCIYCGREPKNIYRCREGIESCYSGLDRLVPSRGYVLSNVVPCCPECNRVKSNVLTPAEMILAMKEIQKFRRKSLPTGKR